MPNKPPTPTDEFYGFLQTAYDHFNTKLFGARLPSCMITVQREKKTMGYFSPHRWSNPEGKKKHEIALNSAYFGTSSLLEVFQTLVHEQCHLWQHEFGTPGRGRYHNREWADKMRECGLVPSDTGRPGGKQTGQKVADYPEPNGRFVRSAVKLLEDAGGLPWVDRILAFDPHFSRAPEPETAPLLSDEPLGAAEGRTNEILEALSTPLSGLAGQFENSLNLAARSKKTKTRYHCDGCGANVWGKPNLDIHCGSCDAPFEAIDA